VGSDSNVPGTTNGDGTGDFAPWLFPYAVWHPSGVQEYTFTFGLDTMNLEECFIVVAYSNIEDVVTGDEYVVWGKNNLKTHGYYLDYCLQECEEPECETAYAYGDDLATCFLDIPEITSNNWGWTNGPISDPSSYSWDIYAGAGQCDISKGTLVGTLDVFYSGGTCTVTYNIDPDFTLDETHLYVGNDMLAKDKKGNYTTAPGQFPFSGETSFTIDGLSGDIYVVAHSVVCGEFDE
jgi:hypothetical protein